MQKVTRLCTTRAIPTVNGKFPGPKIVTREGDRVVVKVVNSIKDNITIHWYINYSFYTNCLVPHRSCVAITRFNHTT
jgi:FtsP/CotA-like multicopper oxidase with cupredoxin domain